MARTTLAVFGVPQTGQAAIGAKAAAADNDDRGGRRRRYVGSSMYALLFSLLELIRQAT